MTVDAGEDIFVAHSTVGIMYARQSNGGPLAMIVIAGGKVKINLTWGRTGPTNASYDKKRVGYTTSRRVAFSWSVRRSELRRAYSDN